MSKAEESTHQVSVEELETALANAEAEKDKAVEKALKQAETEKEAAVQAAAEAAFEKIFLEPEEEEKEDTDGREINAF